MTTDKSQSLESLRERLADYERAVHSDEAFALRILARDYDAALEASERVIESQRLTIKALTDGCERYGLDGTTPVVRHIAALETSLEASERRVAELLKDAAMDGRSLDSCYEEIDRLRAFVETPMASKTRKPKAVAAWALVTERGRIADVALERYQIAADAEVAGERCIRVRITPIRRSRK